MPRKEPLRYLAETGQHSDGSWGSEAVELLAGGRQRARLPPASALPADWGSSGQWVDADPMSSVYPCATCRAGSSETAHAGRCRRWTRS